MKYVNLNTPLCIMVAVFFTQATFGAVISVPNDYPTIQMAINAAIDGDEVIVSPGTWTNTPPIGISKNITLRSIDPTNQAVVASTILTSDINTGSGIMFSGPVNSNCVVSGLTITGFRAYDRGGGIDGNATSPTIQYCRIVSNRVDINGSGGGGIFWANGIIRNNIISDNKLLGPGGGAGLANCSGVITNNIICRNQAGNFGSPDGIYSGGGLSGCSGLIEGNFVYGNSSLSEGGGLSTCNGTIQNNLVWNNTAGESGGGLYSCSGVIRNITVVGNVAAFGGGVSSCSAVLTNCIIWANTASGADPQFRNGPYPSYSCIQDWTGFGVGNTSNDPKFVNSGNPAGVDGTFGTADDGFHILVGSPCIDTGTSFGAPATDITGIARPQGAGIDMGAYEGSAANVYAGTNLTVILPAAAVLNGSAISSNALVTTWSEVSGPGNVTFGNPSSTNTTATFSMAGVYVLRLTASDGVVSANSDTTVNAIQCTYNLSESSRNIGAPSYTNSFLVAVINPCPWTATPSDTWLSILSGGSGVGTGVVNYAASANANSGGRTGTITVADQTLTISQAANAPPQVSIAAVTPLTWPAHTADLNATVTDDGAPYGTVTTTWSEASGPGTVSFGNAGSINTTATFSTNGTYLLSLVASDGALSATGNVTVIVNVAPVVTTPPVVTNSFTDIGGVPVVLPGDPVTFTIGAVDPQGNAVACLWDFGDGQTSTDCEPSHVFSNCGPHTVMVALNDGISTTTTGLIVAVVCPLDVRKLNIKVNFPLGKLDTSTLAGFVELPVGYNVTNLAAQLEIGDVAVPFTLNLKGLGLNGYSSLKLQHKGKPTNLVWQVTGKFKGNFDSVWANNGLTNATVRYVPITMPVLLLLDSDPPEAFYAEESLLYRATAGKSGTAK